MWWGWCCKTAFVNAYPTRASTWWVGSRRVFFLFSWLLLLSIKTRRSVAAADALISGGRGDQGEGWEKPHDEVRMFVKFGCVLRDVNVSTSDVRPPSAPHDDIRRPSKSGRGFYDFLIFFEFAAKNKIAPIKWTADWRHLQVHGDQETRSIGRRKHTRRGADRSSCARTSNANCTCTMSFSSSFFFL